jgi:hypothetical protein
MVHKIQHDPTAKRLIEDELIKWVKSFSILDYKTLRLYGLNKHRLMKGNVGIRTAMRMAINSR